MRIAKKEIRDKNVLEDLLKTCSVGRLGTIDNKGFPVIKPLNFVYLNGRIYFHSAREGEKIDDMTRDNRVCFEVDFPILFVKAVDYPCSADYLYKSVIIKGRACIVEEHDEKLKVLTKLMEKYQPEGGYGAFSEDKLALTAVVRIDVIEMTGKEDLGKGQRRPEPGAIQSV